jgi:DNA-binding transcriptional LysR family regulator
VSGPVRIGAGESRSFHYLSRTAANLAAQHPDIRFHITSGDTRDLMNELADSLIDFAVIFTDVDHSLYESIPLPAEDSFAVLMKKDSPLAEKEEIRISDLKDCPLIVSRASEPLFAGTKLNIVATYNLIYNASLMVEDGLGYAICFDRLINTTGDSRLCVRPLVPRMENAGNLIWKKYQVFSPAVRLFIEGIRKLTEN